MFIVTELTYLNDNHSIPKSEEPPSFQHSTSPTLNSNNTSHDLLMQPVVQLHLLRLSQENFAGTKLVVITVQIQCVEEVTYICLRTTETVRLNIVESVQAIK
jgi:hypothetical protein